MEAAGNMKAMVAKRDVSPNRRIGGKYPVLKIHEYAK